MKTRHHLCAEVIENEKGKIFEALLIKENLILLNSNEPTHYHIRTIIYITTDLSNVS